MAKRPENHDPDRMLDELIDISMGLARKTVARLEKAKTIEEIEACAAAFEILTRDVCESIALSHKLRRDREALQREIEAEAEAEAEAERVAARREAAKRLAGEAKVPRIVH